MTSKERYVDACGAEAYAKNRHGIDGSVLLDPFFSNHIKESSSQGQDIVDAGCGVGPWAIYAARVGASTVYGFDSSEQMLEQARLAIAKEEASVGNKISLELADVIDIPKPAESFDTGLSINVGCALPSIGDEGSPDPFSTHFLELFRVLRPGGTVVVTAPASLETPFTTYGDEGSKIEELEQKLDCLGPEDTEKMKREISGINDILRATIIADAKGWQLIRAQGQLAVGEFIYRKLPGLVVPNYNHPRDEYVAAINAAGFEITDLSSPLLPKDQYNQETGLGSEYISTNPFDIYKLEKPAS